MFRRVKKERKRGNESCPRPSLSEAQLCLAALVLFGLEVFILGVTSEPDKKRYKDSGKRHKTEQAPVNLLKTNSRN